MRILLEIIISNLDLTDTATVAAAVAALTAETSDGVLSDPLNTFGVVDIPTATTGTITTSPLNAASESHHKCCCIKTSILLLSRCQLFLSVQPTYDV